VFALYANSMYGISDDLDGDVLLVARDGSLRTVPTDGLYFGALTLRDKRLYASDHEQEVVIGADRIQSLDRADEDAPEDAQWWAGSTTAQRWSMFNLGTLNTDTYHTGVSATDGKKVWSSDVQGDMVGNTVCADSVYAAIGSWAEPKDPNGTAIHEISVDTSRGADGEVVDSVTEQLQLPPRSAVANLACLDGRIVVLAVDDRTKTLHVGVADDDHSRHWTSSRLMSRKLVSVAGNRVLGTHAGDLITWGRREGIYSIDLETLRARRIVNLTDDEAAAVFTLQDDRILGWVPTSSTSSEIRSYNPVNGQVTERLETDGISAYLQASGYSITGGGGPVPLTGPSAPS